MPTSSPNILVIGAFGQLGSELSAALAALHGHSNVVLADVQPKPSRHPTLELDVRNREAVFGAVKAHDIHIVYHLAAILSARGEQQPALAWDINMNGLLNVLDACAQHNVQRVFWPSSIAIFGPGSAKWDTPQFGYNNPTSIYGITKQAGEHLAEYYWLKRGLDVRSLRYPGLISHSTPPGFGTTDYAVEVFYAAKAGKPYACFLGPASALPMMYMPDAVRATLELMAADASRLSVRTSYNLQALTFTPAELFAEIRRQQPGFQFTYAPDFRQAIADSWPARTDDAAARTDWNWQPAFGLEALVRDMLDKVDVPA